MKESTKTILKGVGIGLGVVAVGGIAVYLINKNKDKEDTNGVKSKRNNKMVCSHITKCDLPQSIKGSKQLEQHSVID